jgi:hypothetical protein
MPPITPKKVELQPTRKELLENLKTKEAIELALSVEIEQL